MNYFRRFSESYFHTQIGVQQNAHGIAMIIDCVLQTVVIPVLIGLLFELVVVVPLRVPVDESPVFLLYQDWALGLVFLKIWTRLVLSLPSLLQFSAWSNVH